MGSFKDKSLQKDRSVPEMGHFKEKSLKNDRFVLEMSCFKDKSPQNDRFVLEKGRFKDKLPQKARFVLEKGGFKDKARREAASKLARHEFAGTEGEEGDGEEESDRVREPDTLDAHAAWEAEDVAGWDCDQEVGGERDPHDGLHIRKASERVCKHDLGSVDELIEHQDRKQTDHDCRDHLVVREHKADLVSEDEECKACECGHDESEVYTSYCGDRKSVV